MKFPFELSDSRFSLLSKEDQTLYLYEHSPYYSWTARQKAMQEYQMLKNGRQQYYIHQLNEDEEFKDIDNKQDVANVLAEKEILETLNYFSDVFGEIFTECGATPKEVEDAKNECISLYYKDAYALDEGGTAAGADMFAWEKGLSGVIKGSMGLALAGVVGLISAGKTKHAIKALKRYMARLVEIIDDGRQKEKEGGLLARIFKSKKMSQKGGDQTTACFRAIQENYSKTIASAGMNIAKALGLLSDTCAAAISDVENNNTTNGGWGIFMQKIGNKLNSLSQN